jgi:hypothetical protein
LTGGTLKIGRKMLPPEGSHVCIFSFFSKLLIMVIWLKDVSKAFAAMKILIRDLKQLKQLSILKGSLLSSDR